MELASRHRPSWPKVRGCHAVFRGEAIRVAVESPFIRQIAAESVGSRNSLSA